MRNIILCLGLVLATSCISTKSTLKNVNPQAVRPTFSEGRYHLTEYATDKKYGYDPDYPINIGFINENQEAINVAYFFNALEGELGEKITYNKTDSCCPFPTKNTTIGAGTLSIYEVAFENSTKKVLLYFNIYEKGALLCPKGFRIKKMDKN